MPYLNARRALVWLCLAVALASGSVTSALASEDVTVAIATPIDSLDPYDTNSTIAQAVGKAYYQGLFTFDRELNVKPLLATGYEVSDDGLTYTIHLRDGVKFQDGTNFNAKAVKVNLERVLDKSNGLARYNQFSRIKRVEVVDPLTVKIILKQPFSALINALAHPAAMMISPTALKNGARTSLFIPLELARSSLLNGIRRHTLRLKNGTVTGKKEFPKSIH